MEQSREVLIGNAGEHLVCTDLLMQGRRAFLSDRACSYDVIVEEGTRLVRVQVRSTLEPRKLRDRKSDIRAHWWYIRRKGKHGNKRYGLNEFDMLALVALDIKRIAYLVPSARSNFQIIDPADFDLYDYATALQGVTWPK